jgi:hypothetical protein
VTHRQLLLDVWGPEFTEHTHYLRLYMAQLRAKLEAEPADPRVLLTEPGVGYMTLAAIGVVYGDIGTSPLYTLKEDLRAAHRRAAGRAPPHRRGVVIFWALMLVVTLKYVMLILRADNRGEGGGLALTALAAQAVARTGPGCATPCCCSVSSAPRCSMATA